MKLLRETIRRIILEDYELTDADIQKYRRLSRDEKSDEEIRQYGDQRGVGIQGKEPIQRDKQAMRDWHKLMEQNPQFVKQFMQGKVQILHSITYEGSYSDKGNDIRSLRPFTDWTKKFGRKSRDQISCVAANVPIGTDPDVWSWDYGNGGSVYSEGFGFLMKGYPAFASKWDLMTQTLSAIPDTLKDFHKSSGQVKRSDSINSAINPQTWKGIDELILDNWEITGIYILDYHWDIDECKSIIDDAYNQGVPVFKVLSRQNYKMIQES